MKNKMTPWRVRFGTNDVGKHTIVGCDGSIRATVERLDDALLMAMSNDLHSALMAHRAVTAICLTGPAPIGQIMDALRVTDEILLKCEGRI